MLVLVSVAARFFAMSSVWASRRVDRVLTTAYALAEQCLDVLPWHKKNGHRQRGSRYHRSAVQRFLPVRANLSRRRANAQTGTIRNFELKTCQLASQPAQRINSMCPESYTCEIFGASNKWWKQNRYEETSRETPACCSCSQPRNSTICSAPIICVGA